MADTTTIAIVSDTHEHRVTPFLEHVYDTYLAPADMLLHCGDHTGFEVWQFFLQHPEFTAVAGNTCEWRLRDELPEAARIRAGGLDIGLVHGWGARSQTRANVAQAFAGQVDVVCYGHTHQSDFSREGDLYMLNPGSLNDSRWGSLALLTLAPGREPECGFIRPSN